MRVFLISLAAIVASPAAASEPRTAAAVIAADDAWLQAEVRGDGAYLDRLLMPGYRSIGSDGKSTDKAALVANASKRGADPAIAAKVAAWKAAHPTRADVRIAGDTAILTWVSLQPGSGEPVSSCDIFVYAGGHWRALYSQHSTAAA